MHRGSSRFTRERQSGSIIHRGIIFAISSNVTNSTIKRCSRDHRAIIASAWMDAKRSAKVHFAGPRKTPDLSSWRNSILEQHWENERLSRFGSRLINRSPFGPFPPLRARSNRFLFFFLLSFFRECAPPALGLGIYRYVQTTAFRARELRTEHGVKCFLFSCLPLAERACGKRSGMCHYTANSR